MSKATASLELRPNGHGFRSSIPRHGGQGQIPPTTKSCSDLRLECGHRPDAERQPQSTFDGSAIATRVGFSEQSVQWPTCWQGEKRIGCEQNPAIPRKTRHIQYSIQLAGLKLTKALESRSNELLTPTHHRPGSFRSGFLEHIFCIGQAARSGLFRGFDATRCRRVQTAQIGHRIAGTSRRLGGRAHRSGLLFCCSRIPNRNEQPFVSIGLQNQGVFQRHYARQPARQKATKHSPRLLVLQRSRVRSYLGAQKHPRAQRITASLVFSFNPYQNRPWGKPTNKTERERAEQGALPTLTGSAGPSALRIADPRDSVAIGITSLDFARSLSAPRNGDGTRTRIIPVVAACQPATRQGEE